MFLLAIRFTSAFLGIFMLGEVPTIFAPWRVVLYVVSVAVIALSPLTTRKYPKRFSIIYWLLVVIFVGAELWFQWKSGAADQIFFWFLCLAGMAEATKSNFKLVTTIRDVNWLVLTVDLTVVPILFGTVLFEKIPSRFGGGKPVAVVFQFAGASPIDGAAKDKLWLADEGDSGFYVLQAPDDKKGIFLPRAAVAAIYYDAGSDAARLP
jgi:hypothetical protein